MACATSITGSYLAKKASTLRHAVNYDNRMFTVRGANEHNLRHVDVSIPIQQLVIMTGVSGSGKSTFLFGIVDKIARKHFNRASDVSGKYNSVEGLEYFNRVITVNQTSIGNTKSSRSNVATYTKLFGVIRDLFASQPEANKRRFGADKFSFNTSDERCENCNGAGVVDVDMTFMPDIEVVCPTCNGMRFNEDVLAVQFQGNNITDVLDMTVDDARYLFKNEKKIFLILDAMKQVGLEYLKLGQSTSTLSGGEAQRIKLAAELSKSETGNTLYLLDEPATGLHPQEVDKLIGILRKLVSKGNTVIAIEHNMDVIRNADTIIDFGPGGGNSGGTIVTTGTPQQVAAHPTSLTGKALRAYSTITDHDNLIRT